MAKSLLDPTIIAVATDMHDGGFIRAIVVRPDPGAGCELYLQRIEYGDEASPHRIAQQQTVAYSGPPPAKMHFSEGCVYLIESDADGAPETFYVRASPTELGDKAHRER